MCSSGEGNEDLIDELNQQLEATFGCSGTGSLNLRELHQLLHKLIDLQRGHGDNGKKNSTASGLYPSSVKETGAEHPTVPFQNTSTSEEFEATYVAGEKLDPKCDAGHEQSSSVSCEKVTAASLSDDVLVQTSSVQSAIEKPTNERTSLEISTKVENNQALSSAITCDESLNNSEVLYRDSNACSTATTVQRSSDFEVKSTTTSSTSRGCTTTLLNDEESCRDAQSSSSQGSPKSVPEMTADISQEKCTGVSSSSSFKGAPTSVGLEFAQPPPNFVAILEGCKSHLETLKEEVLALKTRCQAQHKDMLKLAGTVDTLVECLGEQEPKVSKLETDIRCLGVLISDYEDNFAKIEKRLEHHDKLDRESARTIQRMDKARDVIGAELRTVTEQLNYLASVKADKLDVQTELHRRALTTEMELRVPYEVFNESVRELNRTVTLLREELHDVEENLKTVQYELLTGLDAKASAQELKQIRKQLVGALARWQRAGKLQKSIGTAPQLILRDVSSAAVATSGGMGINAAKCLSCGVQTKLEGNYSAIPLPVSFTPSSKVRSYARNAGGLHTQWLPSEKVFRTGSLGLIKSAFNEHKEGISFR